jgi:CTP:molybdopterin cytidylyltransferase MocA
VLAAGQGSRFGGDKLLAPWRGRPLVAHTLAAVRAAVDAGILGGGYVVVPAGRAELIGLALQAGLEPVENAAPADGLAGSLRLGIERLERTVAHGGPAAAVIFLADQPLVQPEVVARVVAAWDGGRRAAVRPRYAGAPEEPGHPMLLDRTLWSLAASLTAEAGFAPTLAARGITALVVDVPGSNPDIDTPADLSNL